MNEYATSFDNSAANALPANRAQFIRKTYLLLAAAILAFIVVEAFLFATGAANAIASLMRKMTQNTPGRDYTFYNAWLYSLEWRYLPSQYPYQHWKGPTLGIAFEKTPPNVAAVKSLGIHG